MRRSPIRLPARPGGRAARTKTPVVTTTSEFRICGLFTLRLGPMRWARREQPARTVRFSAPSRRRLSVLSNGARPAVRPVGIAVSCRCGKVVETSSRNSHPKPGRPEGQLGGGTPADGGSSVR